MLGLGLAAGTAVHADETLYLVDHTITIEGRGGGTLRNTAFSGLTLQRAPDGSARLHTRLLWSQQRGGGHTRSTDELDPTDDDAATLLEVLAAGFELPMSADGSAGAMRAADAAAWRRLVAREPRIEQTLIPPTQTLGMRIRALPDRLRVGQVMTHREQSQALGDIDTRLEVRAVDAAVAVLEVSLEGDTFRGSGRQAVRRVDGMPLEVRLRLDMQPADGMPATVHRLRMVSLDTEPLLALDRKASDRSTGDYLDDLLAAPPFSSQPDDPALYDAEAHPRGALAGGMLDLADLPDVEPQLRFALEPRGEARARIALRARMAAVDDDAKTSPPLLVVRLRHVALRDASGRALSDLDAIPVQPRLVLTRDWYSDEGEAAFPFRLPLGTSAGTLDTLQTIRVEVDVETFAWDGGETIASGVQPLSQPGAHIHWTSPQRITFEQPNARPGEMTGVWSLPVPLDADGRAVPVAALIRTPHEDSDGTLNWERRHAPQRIEIATSEPIAAIELRRYRWRMVPRTWSFERADRVD